MMHHTMISAIILFHNESDSIKRCIDSVRWCDEVIIIDDCSSSHARKQIPDRKNIQLYIRRLGGDFSAQRNFGLKKAMGEWVLFVDADEAVSCGLRKEIEEISQNLTIAKSCDAFWVQRRDYFLGRWLLYGETSAVRLVRLGKKNAGVWEGNVHETWNIHGPIGVLEEPLQHYPHPTIAEFIESINIYSTLVAKQHTPLLSSTSYAEASSVKTERRDLRVITHPAGKFFQNYILRLGFLDGIPGLIMAVMMSFHSFLVRGKGWEKSR